MGRKPAALALALAAAIAVPAASLAWAGGPADRPGANPSIAGNCNTVTPVAPGRCIAPNEPTQARIASLSLGHEKGVAARAAQLECPPIAARHAEAFGSALAAMSRAANAAPHDTASAPAEPSHRNSCATQGEAAVSTTDRAAESSPEKAPEKEPETPPAPATRTLTVGGTSIPYRDVRGGTTPSSGAGLWLGSDNVDDGSWGYFVGHNPGSFAPVRHLAAGDSVMLCNGDGDHRAYTVRTVFTVEATATWKAIASRVTGYGESVILQTCTGDGVTNTIVVAA